MVVFIKEKVYQSEKFTRETMITTLTVMIREFYNKMPNQETVFVAYEDERFIIIPDEFGGIDFEVAMVNHEGDLVIFKDLDALARNIVDVTSACFPSLFTIVGKRVKMILEEY
jgi:hypothetical protein